MAAQGTFTLAANVTGGPDGARSLASTITANAAITQTTSVALVIGSVTVTVPTGSTVALILPPNSVNPTPNPSYAGTVTLKGVAGDTGVLVSNKWPTVLSFDAAGPASFVLTATVAGTATVWFM